MRTASALLLSVAALAVAVPAAPAATPTHRCPQTDPANGLVGLRAGGLSCAKAFAVARRTNAIKCFLDGDTCSHRFKGRTWRCRLTDADTSPRVRCTSGAKVVRYRIG
jgi:hypothetical protein